MNTICSASLEVIYDKLVDLHIANEQVAYHLRAKLNWYKDDGKPVTDLPYDLKVALEKCHESWGLIDEITQTVKQIPCDE
jgi:hypothetical protein